MIIKNCKCYNSELIIYYVQLIMQFVIDYMLQELHYANLTFFFFLFTKPKKKKKKRSLCGFINPMSRDENK